MASRRNDVDLLAARQPRDRDRRAQVGAARRGRTGAACAGRGRRGRRAGLARARASSPFAVGATLPEVRVDGRDQAHRRLVVEDASQSADQARHGAVGLGDRRVAGLARRHDLEPQRRLLRDVDLPGHRPSVFDRDRVALGQAVLGVAQVGPVAGRPSRRRRSPCPPLRRPSRGRARRGRAARRSASGAASSRAGRWPCPSCRWRRGPRRSRPGSPRRTAARSSAPPPRARRRGG